jgi:hypothetical protein
MDLLREIALQAIEIMTLVFGILGMTLSLLLLFTPKVAQGISVILNRRVDIDQKLGVLDKNIPSDQAIYGHPLAVGVGLICGSVFALFFFFFNFDAVKFAQVFFGSHHHAFSGEILFEAVAWIGKIGCLFGLLIGIGLIAAPRRLRAIDQKVNVQFETRSWFEKIQQPTHSLDVVFFRYPILSGVLVGFLSCVLIVISILNLLR